MAIVLDDLRKMGFTVNRNSIEQAVWVGSTTDNRYFAKDSNIPILLGKQEKCCLTIDKEKVAQDAVQNLIQSKNTATCVILDTSTVFF